MITKSHNHNHFWIEDNTIYESYNTIRGLRFRPIGKVIMNDNEKLTDDDIYLVNQIMQIMILLLPLFLILM